MPGYCPCFIPKPKWFGDKGKAFRLLDGDFRRLRPLKPPALTKKTDLCSMSKTLFTWLITCLLLATTNPARAQQQEPAPADSTTTDSLLQIEQTYDTLPVVLFAERLSSTTLRHSTLFENALRYDPSRRQTLPFAQTGNLGSPAAPIAVPDRYWTDGFTRRGLDIGLHAFDPYHYRTDSLYFFQRQKAYTKAHFSQGPTQESLMTSLHFGRGFGDKLRFAIRFRRINNAGYFTHFQSFADALVAGMYYHKPPTRYRSYAYFVHNENRQQENGGIQAEATDLFGNAVVAPPAQLEINTAQAMTRLAENTYTYSQYLHLSQPDTNTTSMQTSLPNGWHVHAKTALGSFEYKFYDDQANLSKLVYDTLLNERGMRLFVRNLRMEQELNLLYLKWPSDSSRSRKIQAGLHYQYNHFRFEPHDTIITTAYATTRGLWQFPFAQLQWKGFYALHGEPNAYLGKLVLQTDNLQLEALAISRQASRIYQAAYITRQVVWQANRKSEKLYSLQITQSLSGDHFRLGLQFSQLQNAVYLDTTFLPVQIAGSTQIATCSFQSKLHWWKLHYEQNTRLSLSSSPELPLPGLYSEQQLYFQSALFKGALELTIGSELRLLSPYKLVGYQQALGVFYQSENRRNWQPILNGFLAGQMKNIRFYLALENLLPPLTNRYYYLVDRYPLPQMALRFGIKADFRG